MTHEHTRDCRNITTRSAREAEKDFVYRLNRVVYHDRVIRQFGAWAEHRQQQYFEEKWARAAYRIIEYGGIPIGVMWTTEHVEEHVLHELQILPDYQGLGIGSALIRQEIARTQRQHRPLRLRVLTQNIRAQHLYTRLGFVVSQATDTHLAMEYQDNRDIVDEKDGYSMSISEMCERTERNVIF